MLALNFGVMTASNIGLYWLPGAELEGWHKPPLAVAETEMDFLCLKTL